MSSPIKIASRSSPLALVQVEEVLALLKAKGVSLDYETFALPTRGDIDRLTSLTANPGDNFFTDTLDQALLHREADLTIHSAKDLPQQLPDGLSIFALTETMDDRDAWVGIKHWQDLPPSAKVGTSSTLRQQQVCQIRPDLEMVDIRGTIQERIQLVKDGKVDGVIVAACALKRLQLVHEIKDILPWEGMPLQGQLALVGRREDQHLCALVAPIDVRRHYGRVTLVGAGPGDPSLITLKGINALEAAGCVFYDYLVDPVFLKYAPKAEHVYVGKRKGEHSLTQASLSRMLKERALVGQQVVRLKGGDPLIFGRGADEINYLRAYHIEVDVIPGVSSATGIPSSLGIPLTARGVSSSVVFVSGHGEEDSSHNSTQVYIPRAQTIVFLMGLTKLGVIIQSLKEARWRSQTPVIIISNATRIQEQIVKGTIETIEHLAAEAQLKQPALIIVGDVVNFYQPKQKKVYLHCGTRPDVYHQLGTMVAWPMIAIKPVVLTELQCKQLWQEFDRADIILCTSRYAVAHFINQLLQLKPLLDLSSKVFIAIGQQTSDALNDFNIKPFLVADKETAEGLLGALTKAIGVSGKKILFPRSSLPNPFLKDALISRGAVVTEVVVYANTKPPKRDLPDRPIDGVIFTSPSTVRNFLEDYVTIPDSWQVIAKGPVTLKTLQEAGYTHATALS